MSAARQGARNRLIAPSPQGRVGVSAEVSHLYRIIEAITAGPDLDSVLRSVVHLIVEATGSHHCSVYFRHRDSLILRAASSDYAHLAGKVSLGIGQGVTGWVAQTRRPVVIREGASRDARYFQVPGLEGEEFGSIVCVPVFGRTGDAIGVITLQAVPAAELGQTELDFLEHTASLIAAATENARSYDEARSQVHLLTRLSAVVQQITAANSIDELQKVVVAAVRSVFDTQRCDLYLRNETGSFVRAPVLSSEPGSTLGTEWMALPQQSLAAQICAEMRWSSACVAVLSVGNDRMGVLVAELEDSAPGRQEVLEALAAHAALAVKHVWLVESLKEANLVKDFFEALSTGTDDIAQLRSGAVRLRTDLDAPHVVLHILPTSRTTHQGSWMEAAARLEKALQRAPTRVVCDYRDQSARSLVEIKRGSSRAALDLVRGAYEHLAKDRQQLTIGVSSPRVGPRELMAGFGEAAAAAELGGLLRTGGGVFTIDDVGAYRYLLSAPTPESAIESKLARLEDYDRRRGTQLLNTLESYMEHRGNLVATARSQYTHPNTMRQRLDRIELVTSLDLRREDWLSMGMAVKAVKLRRMRTEAMGEE